MAVRQPLDRDRVVEVARVLAVDGDDRTAAEVGAAADVGGARPRASRARASATASGECASGMPCLRRMISVSTPGSSMSPSTSTTRPTALAPRTRPARISTVTISPASAADGRRPGGRGLSVSSTGVERHDDRQRHWRRRRSGRRPCALRRSRIRASRPSARPSSVGARCAPTTRSPCIAPAERSRGCRCRRRRARVGHDEAEAAGVGLQPADDEVDPVGQREAVAADRSERAVGRPAPVSWRLNGGPLVARDVEKLRAARAPSRDAPAWLRMAWRSVLVSVTACSRRRRTLGASVSGRADQEHLQIADVGAGRSGRMRSPSASKNA